MTPADELLAQEGSSMPTETPEEIVRLPQVSIDFKLPAWSLVSVAIMVGSGLISMYFQLARVGDDVTELKAAVKTSGASTIQFAQEQALIKYRVEKLEANEMRGIK